MYWLYGHLPLEKVWFSSHLQCNLDLSNYYGTEEMRSLYHGFVKSKTSIY